MSIVSSTWWSFWRNPVGRYLHRVLLGLDQLGNTLLGFLPDYGDPDETISSVLGRRAARGKLRLVEKPLVWALDKLDENHVADAIEWDEKPARKMLRAPRIHSEGS